MAKLTPEQIAHYVENGGVTCPHCGSEDLRAGRPEDGEGNYYQNVLCWNCKQEWTDEYSLTGVTELEEL